MAEGTTETTTEQEVGIEETIIESESEIDSELESMFSIPDEETPAEEETPEAEPEEETPEEETEDAEPEAEASEEEASEDEPEEEVSGEKKSKKLDPEMQTIVDDRIKREINKMKAEQKEAMEALEAEKEAAKRPTSASEKVRASWDHDELDTIDDKQQEIIDFVADNPEGYTDTDGEIHDADKLRAMASDARKVQREIRPRRKLILESQQHNAELAQIYPELKNSDSAQSLEIKRILNRFPGLKQHANANTLAVAITLGIEQLTKGEESTEGEKPKATPKKVAKKVKAAVVKAPNLGSPTQKSGITGNKAGVSSAVTEALNSGDDEAIDDYLEKMFPS